LISLPNALTTKNTSPCAHAIIVGAQVRAPTHLRRLAVVQISQIAVGGLLASEFTSVRRHVRPSAVHHRTHCPNRPAQLDPVSRIKSHNCRSVFTSQRRTVASPTTHAHLPPQLSAFLPLALRPCRSRSVASHARLGSAFAPSCIACARKLGEPWCGHEP